MGAIQVLQDGVRGLCIVVLLLLSIGPGCVDRPRPEIDEHALMLRIRDFEAELAPKSDAQKQAALAALADDMLHRHVRARSATVVAVYERGEDWNTSPFFGFDYVEAHYLHLIDLDPEFHRQLHGMRYWASVACTSGDRQLMFELAMDPETHAGLRPGQDVSFTCEVAGIIRGKTVYGRLITIGS
jgi:hypothetical protein